jgi:hypothetical protein
MRSQYAMERKSTARSETSAEHNKPSKQKKQTTNLPTLRHGRRPAPNTTNNKQQTPNNKPFKSQIPNHKSLNLFSHFSKTLYQNFCSTERLHVILQTIMQTSKIWFPN